VDAPLPPEDFSLQDWGILVAIVTAAGGAIYAIGRIVLMPAFRGLVLRSLSVELEALRANSASLVRMWPEQLQQRETLARIEEGQHEIREALAEMRGRDGGRRGYDQR
jgi:hypothetical protein